MLPAERLGRILGALLGEGRPRTLRGAACRKTAGRRPTGTAHATHFLQQALLMQCVWQDLWLGLGLVDPLAVARSVL